MSIEKDINKKSVRGGAREGAGRKPGSKNKINKATVQTVIEKLYQQAGQFYEDMLIEDFVKARQNNAGLAYKYHQLLVNKILPDLSHVELADSADTIDQKREAFEAALRDIIGQPNAK